MNRELTEAEHIQAEAMHDPDAELEALLAEHLRAARLVAWCLLSVVLCFGVAVWAAWELFA